MSPSKNQSSIRRFLPLKKKIADLKKNNSRFKKVFREYELISKELWDLETSEEISVSDDFLDAINLQTDYLEEEIENWLHPESEN
mgnify:CR=1 FL=1